MNPLGSLGAGLGALLGESTTSMGLPWPKGDPGQVKAAASKLNTLATKLTSDSSDLSRAAEHEGVWNAPASRSFATAVRGLRSEMSRAQGQLNDAAGALKELAQRIQLARQRIRDLDEKVRKAKERAEAARLGADKAFQSLGGARRTEAAGGASADDANRASVAAEGKAVDAEGDYEDVLRKAKKEARQECDEVLRQDRATARALKAAKAPFGGRKGKVPPLPTSRLANHVAPHFAPILRHDSAERSFPTSVPFGYKPGPDGKGIQLDFWPRYRDNDHWAPRGFFDHDGDFERVAVQLDGEGKLDVVATEAHGAWQGKRRAEDMETRGGQPIVYAGLGSHALYPEKGTNYADKVKTRVRGKDVPFPSPDLTGGERELDTRGMVKDMRTEPDLNTGQKPYPGDHSPDSPVKQAQDRPLREDLDSFERSDGAGGEVVGDLMDAGADGLNDAVEGAKDAAEVAHKAGDKVTPWDGVAPW